MDTKQLVIFAAVIIGLLLAQIRNDKKKMKKMASNVGNNMADVTGNYNTNAVYYNAPSEYILHGQLTVQGLTGLSATTVEDAFKAVQ